jgi:probable rRNA maturation factor
MEVSVRNRQKSIRTDPARIERTLRSALDRLASSGGTRGCNLATGRSFDPLKASVGVLLVGDRCMRALNRDYRGIDRTTDVLSFSQLEGKLFRDQSSELGDIVISPAQARRQAVERGETFEQEMDTLLIHGLLHLIGYDHEKNSYQARKMRAREKELLLAVQKIGRQRK